jgi:hypothetical protein
MAFDLGNDSAGRSRIPGARYKRTQISQINVTPMVDVMLVLLVVFMDRRAGRTFGRLSRAGRQDLSARRRTGT